MPSPEQHEFQVKHNRELLKFLETSNKRDYFRDWYVTIAFYTAYTALQADKKLLEVMTECLKVKDRYEKLSKAD